MTQRTPRGNLVVAKTKQLHLAIERLEQDKAELREALETLLSDILEWEDVLLTNMDRATLYNIINPPGDAIAKAGKES